jgi:mono/diheme cytochrome c family protein
MIYQPCVTGITELRQQRLQYKRLRVYSPCVVELKNSNGACQMNKVLIIVIALAVVLALPLAAYAQNGEALYKAKCAMCHGADGKKAVGHDLSGADVQKGSDADLATVITNGKPPKMPAYKTLKPEDVTGLVAYIRTLKK